MKRFKLNRRTMLRGMIGGSMVTAGLPLLEAMLNDNGTAHADGGDLVCRMATYYWADGVTLDRFEPGGSGANWTLSEQMAPLAPVKDYLNVITGLQNPSTVSLTHHDGMTVFNGYDLVFAGGGFSSNSGGPTIDQLVADRIAGESTVRSISVQNSKQISTDGDSGTTHEALSHRGTPGNLIPQYPQLQPADVWATLFGNFAQPIDTRPPRTRVLDAVREDAARLRKRLGTIDQQRLDAHLIAVDELQTKIEAVAPACDLPDQPTVVNGQTGPNGGENISEVQDAMSHLIAQAFVCDVTRVASFMFKRFVSSTTFDEINAGNAHHAASHDPSGGNGNNTYNAGVTYCMEKFSQFLQVLQSYEDVPGQSNLLDSTIIYASTDCSTPWNHSIKRQPIIIAGNVNGYLKSPGVHYQATAFNGNNDQPNAANQSTSEALLTCLRAYDAGAASVGGGAGQATNVIDEILA